MSPLSPPFSPNEIQFYFTRAAVGAGAPFGLGEELAAAAVWLASVSRDPAEFAASALTSLAHAQDGRQPIISNDHGAIIFDSADRTPLSAIYVGPCVADYIVMAAAANREISVAVRHADQPILLAAYVGARLRSGTACLEFANAPDTRPVTITAGRNGADCHGLQTAGPFSSGAVTIDFSPIPADAQALSGDWQPRFDVLNGIEMATEPWQTVYQYFERCLVPSSDQSREKGAGAGLADND